MDLNTDVYNEIRSQIASCLTFKDSNSAVQTSETLHSKMDITKQKIDLRIGFENGSLKIMNFSVRVKRKDGVRETDRRRWDAKLCIKPKNPKGRKIYSDQEKAAMVADFYYAKRGENDGPLERIFPLGHTEGLASHLQFVFSQLQVDTLKLGQRKSLNDVNIVTITKTMKENQVNVDNLHIHQNIDENMMNLIVSCNPKCLVVCLWSSDIPQKFFRLPVIRKLSKLVIDTWLKTIDIDIFFLEATELKILSKSHLQIADAEKYLTQWMENKRDIQSLFFRSQMDENVDDLTMLLSIIDKNLATVRNIIDSRDQRFDRNFSLQITRISDGATISLIRSVDSFKCSLV